ncbi:MAG: LLM class flavin-dependent oxidoreductase [Dehalococcoidia bacterium]|nr:LLM class flavin-dependent oxidoreductase [Dehalococcoidia bacterium]
MSRKVILQVYPTLGGPEEMERRRPIGRDREAYQNMIESLVECVQAADELGYWGITHVEHHFHSEGLEISPDPGLLNLHLGHYTKRLNHGQLGFVLPSRDPIRLAEEIAMIDHMLKGRFFVGMARGYQARWQNILGQHYHATAAPSDQGEIDSRNRDLFYEHFKIMKLAWSEDLLTYNSPDYQVPYPYEEGIKNWPPAQVTTSRYGVPGEVDGDGTVRGISVVPKPYQIPHPPLFQAFSVSESTLRWCAREGVVPSILFGPLDIVHQLATAYHEEAQTAGQSLQFGEKIGIVRSVHIVDSEAELLDSVERYDVPVWQGWYQPFGFIEACLRFPGEEGPVPAAGESVAERLVKSNLVIGGTVDQVKRQVDALLKQVPFEYLIWLFHWGIYPNEYGLRQLDLFSKHIMPEFGMTYSPKAPVSA